MSDSQDKQVKLVTRAFRYRIWPTPEQEEVIRRTMALCQFTYNKFLALRDYEYKRFKYPDDTPINDEFEMMLSFAKRRKDGRADLSRFGMTHILTRYKKVARFAKSGECVYPSERGVIDSWALNGMMQSLDAAFKRYFDNVRKGIEVGKGPGRHAYGYPRFKNRAHPCLSYHSHSQNVSIDMDGRRVRLSCLGWVRFDASREPLGHIQQATVSVSKTGRFYLSLSCSESPVEVMPHTGASVGVDLGVKELAVLSDGTVFDNPKLAYHAQNRKKRLDRARSRRQPKRGQKPSKRYLKKKHECARWEEKVRDRRAAAVHNMTHAIVRDNDVVALEDLNVKGMLSNHHLAKAVSDASLSEIARQIEYKADWHDRVTVKVDRFYPSSKTCSVCGHVQDMPLSKRTYVCPVCGNVMDRDLNAAVNIEREGRRLLEQKP